MKNPLKSAEPVAEDPLVVRLSNELADAKVARDLAVHEAEAVYSAEKEYVLEAATTRARAIESIQAELVQERGLLDGVIARATTPEIA